MTLIPHQFSRQGLNTVPYDTQATIDHLNTWLFDIQISTLLTFSFFFGEASISLVCLWVGKINLLVGHIEISTHDHRFLLVQLFQVTPGFNNNFKINSIQKCLSQQKLLIWILKNILANMFMTSNHKFKLKSMAVWIVYKLVTLTLTSTYLQQVRILH